MARRLLYRSLVKNPREMLAAGFGGAVGSLFDFATLVLLVEYARANIPLSAWLASAAGAVACFLLNKHLAFRDRTPVTASQVMRFGGVAVATACLTAVLMKIVAVDLGVDYLLAKLLCAVAVFIAWTYPAQRRLVFRRHAHAL